MNQTEIDELRRLASVSREPRHGIGCIASDCALASAARNAIPRLLAALEEARAERDKADARIQQVHNWYADRWERLRAFLASGSLMEKGACDIMANGRLMIDAFPASPLALAVARAEGAEAERDALKAKLAALVEATADVHEKLRINADGKATVTVGKAIALRRELGEALAAAKVQP